MKASEDLMVLDILAYLMKQEPIGSYEVEHDKVKVDKFMLIKHKGGQRS